MRDKNTVFYRRNTEVLTDLSADRIRSDGAALLFGKDGT